MHWQSNDTIVDAIGFAARLTMWHYGVAHWLHRVAWFNLYFIPFSLTARMGVGMRAVQISLWCDLYYQVRLEFES